MHSYQQPQAKATPHQVKAEVWMSLVHGSRGLIYFVHQFKPRFNEHALLDDPEMLEPPSPRSTARSTTWHRC